MVGTVGHSRDGGDYVGGSTGGRDCVGHSRDGGDCRTLQGWWRLCRRLNRW